MKKIISWASALALVSSSFVALPLSANAEVTGTLYSNSFNGYANTVTYDAYAGTVGDVMVYGGNSAQLKVDDMNLITNSRAGGDDTSYWKATTEDGNTYLTTTTSRFSTAERGAKLTFDEPFLVPSDGSLVVSFKYKITAPITEGYAPVFKVGGATINAASFAADDSSVYDTWYNAKVVIDAGGAAVYNGSNYVSGGDSSDQSFSAMYFHAYDASGNVLGAGSEKREAGYGDYMTVSIDDLVVFTSNSATPETDEVPAAEDPTGSVVTPSPDPTNAPKAKVTVPDNATDVKSANFDSQDISGGKRVRVYPATPAMTFDDGDFTVSAGTSKDTRSGTYGEVKAYTYGEEGELSSQVLEMYDGGHASAARGPKVELTNNVSTADLTEEGASYRMTFQVKLDDGAAGPAKLYFVDTKGDNKDNPDVYSYLGSDGQYKYVLATLTTGEEDSANGVINIPQGEFVVVTFYLFSDGTYGIEINGESKYEHTGDVQYDGSSDYKITPSQLPALVINTTKGDITNTKATIDDMYVYKLVGDPVVTTYSKYAATYDEDGILTGLNIENNVDPSTVDVSGNTTTSKTFVWSGRMVPYTAE